VLGRDSHFERDAETADSVLHFSWKRVIADWADEYRMAGSVPVAEMNEQWVVCQLTMNADGAVRPVDYSMKQTTDEPTVMDIQPMTAAEKNTLTHI